MTFVFCGIVSILGLITTIFLIHDGPEDPSILDDQFEKYVSETPELVEKLQYKKDNTTRGADRDKTQILLTDHDSDSIGVVDPKNSGAMYASTSKQSPKHNEEE